MTKFLSLAFFILFFTSVQAQMEFVENKGQWHEKVNYKGDFKTGSFFLEDAGFTVLLYDTSDVRRLSEIFHGHGKQPANLNGPFVFNSHAYKVKLLGAADRAQHFGEKEFPTYNNYYLGNEPAKWQAGCKIFGAITYKDVYPNIDLRYYSSGGRLKYDFIVHPGGNPGLIALQYEGAQLSIADKELLVKTPLGTVRELYPYSYQSGVEGRRDIDCRYTVKNNVVTFKLRGYDPSSVLVIDPTVIFASFTGSSSDNWGYTATPGPGGTFYSGGIMFGDGAGGFPVSPGAYQVNYGGGSSEFNFVGYDIVIFKFSANGSNRLYATYLGGTANEQPHSMIVDPSGNLIVAGRSTSSNYPSTVSAGPLGKYDIVVTKFNPDGTSLIGSARIGGSEDDGVNVRPKYSGPQGADLTRRNYGDDARSEVILDGSNNILLVSSTQSNNFFVTPGAFQNSFGGGTQDGVILKFDPQLTSVLLSTYFGGSGTDACFVASVNPLNNEIYVGGGTTGPDLPGDKTGAWQPAFRSGVADGFVTRLNAAGSAVIKTSFAGTDGTDIVYGLKFDKFGFPYIMGTTTGAWPVINAPFSNAGSKQFIVKLNADLSSPVYSTVFGTNSASPNISPVAFLVDRCENVYVSGWGGGINNSQGYNGGNTSGMALVNPLSGIPPPDGQDFYFFVMERNATRQLFGSNYGQFRGIGDHADGGTSRFDENGIIYQAICANCGNDVPFPTTPGVWATTNGSANCNQVALKIEMNYAGVGSSVQTSINNIVGDTRGCVPLTVKFADTLQQGVKFYWDFGDGSVDTTSTFTTEHTFNTVGVYTVKLISEDSTKCNIRDSAYVQIIAGDKIATPDFTFNKVLPCESLTMRFTNTSSATSGSFGTRTFVWDYGDGSAPDTANFNPPRLHTYAAPGTYFVTLSIIDTNFCNTPVTDTQRINLNPLVKAIFSTPAMGCAPYNASFSNQSLAGTDWLWEFGDGNTSTDFEPVHVYQNPGTYRVRLIASDTSTCNKVDTSAYFTIEVYEKPTAIISSWGPNPPRENTPVDFGNGSINATRFEWDFGDGETSSEIAPSHQYISTGSFEVRLVAFNAAGCSDTTYENVQVIIVPLLDVPNAFTPGKFGENAVVSVKGFGIASMDWRIYNRYGQLVFNSTSVKLGWDGMFRGKLQPMDVYTYTLDVRFSDGKTLRKTGDISLLR